ncbi:MAG: nucleotidyltransferase family protein [Oscillospiraceae bacterium]|nr:nucleotidyltransferase family protein [Oscillospiraceae bacterium]
MSVIGIVCEFNPFHNGHKYLIDSVKKDGDTVVCVMSGNFVQRGEPAIADKRIRAKTALLCGADLVIELPVAFSVAGAQTFARGGVKLLDSLGVVDTLAFGSECGNIEMLERTADAIESEQVNGEIIEILKTGETYAFAREKAVRKIYGGDLADILHNPNDILAVEYISALNFLHSKIKPKAVLRKSVLHDSTETEGVFASASLIREKMKKGESFKEYLPHNAFEILENAIKNGNAPADYAKLDIAILAFLRKATAEDFSDVPDVSEGIENRIIAAARNATTLSEVFDNSKTKRYTHARIRRIVLCAFLGIKNSHLACGLPYIRVLGFNDKGRELLHKAVKTASLPITVRLSDISNLGTNAEQIFQLESTATDIFNLTLPKIRECGTEMTDSPVVI